MNIMLNKNGNLIITEAGEPLEGDEAKLDELAVMLTDPKDGDSIVYDGENKVWKPGTVLPLNISEPENGDILTYDSESGKWVNTPAGE